MVWTAPSGHTYTTTPEGAAMFPTLAGPTGTLILPRLTTPAAHGRGLMMPRRKRTRDQDRRYRRTAERAIKEARLANQPAPPPDPWATPTDEPLEAPPF